MEHTFIIHDGSCTRPHLNTAASAGGLVRASSRSSEVSGSRSEAMGRLGRAAGGGLYIASSQEITATCAHHSDEDYYGEQCSAFRGADARYLQ